MAHDEQMNSCLNYLSVTFRRIYLQFKKYYIVENYQAIQEKREGRKREGKERGKERKEEGREGAVKNPSINLLSV